MVQSGAIASFAVSGLLTVDTLLMTGFLFVPFILACRAGMRLFARASDAQFRNLTLWGIAALSLAIAVL